MAETFKNTAAEAAQEAVDTRRKNSAEQRRSDRKARAAERMASKAFSEKSPYEGLRILADAEGERGRKGPDWDRAKTAADRWRKSAEAKGFFGTLAETKSIKEARLARAARITETPGFVRTFAETGSYRKAIDAGLDKMETKLDRRDARAELAELRTNDVAQEAIATEHSRLIKQAGRELSEKEMADLQIDAENNVRAAMEYQRAKREEAKTNAESNPRFHEVLNEALNQKQSEERRALTNQERADVRSEVIDELTDETLDIMDRREDERAAEEAKIAQMPEFIDQFMKELGKPVQDASPAEIATAREKAIEATWETFAKQEQRMIDEREAELAKYRGSTEWQSAFATLLNERISDGVQDTPELRTELQAQVDSQLELKRAKDAVATTTEDLEEKKRAESVISERIAIIEARREMIDLRGNRKASKADEEAYQQAKKRYNDMAELHRQRLITLESINPKTDVINQQIHDTNLIVDMVSIVDDSTITNNDLVKWQQSEQGQLTTAQDELKIAKEAADKAGITLQVVKESIKVLTQQLVDSLTSDEAAKVNAALGMQSGERQRELQDVINNRLAGGAAGAYVDSYLIQLLRELFTSGV
jgi:hypothetical protein